jgi:hypothetical protein
MTIGDLVRRIPRRDPNPDGGSGGLTDEELAPFTDLLNGPHKVCECGSPGCGCPIIPPRGLP